MIERLDKLIIPTLESLGKDVKVRAGGIAGDTSRRLSWLLEPSRKMR